ncbi:MAG: hypothetical protein NC254_09620 [bacterium]|nr:hypothetical protein [bacterium]
MVISTVVVIVMRVSSVFGAAVHRADWTAAFRSGQIFGGIMMSVVTMMSVVGADRHCEKQENQRCS